MNSGSVQDEQKSNTSLKQKSNLESIQSYEDSEEDDKGKINNYSEKSRTLFEDNTEFNMGMKVSIKKNQILPLKKNPGTTNEFFENNDPDQNVGIEISNNELGTSQKKNKKRGVVFGIEELPESRKEAQRRWNLIRLNYERLKAVRQ